MTIESATGEDPKKSCHVFALMMILMVIAVFVSSQVEMRQPANDPFSDDDSDIMLNETLADELVFDQEALRAESAFDTVEISSGSLNDTKAPNPP